MLLVGPAFSHGLGWLLAVGLISAPMLLSPHVQCLL